MTPKRRSLSTVRFPSGPADGTSLDDYTDPQGRFVQQCTVIEHPDLPGFRAYIVPTSRRW